MKRISTGIYRTTRFSIREQTRLPTDERIDFAPMIDRLPQIKAALLGTLKPHIVKDIARPTSVEEFTRQASPGRIVLLDDRMLVVKKTSDAMANRAVDALEWIDLLEAAIDRKDIRTAVDEALRVGAALEKLKITPHEPDASRGRKNRNGVARGAAITNAKRRQKSKELDRKIILCAASYRPTVKKTWLYPEVAEKCGCGQTRVRECLRRHAKKV